MKKFYFQISAFLIIILVFFNMPSTFATTELSYDDGTSDRDLYKFSADYVAVRFSLPTATSQTKILSVRYFITDLPYPFRTYILAEDGNTELFSSVVNPKTKGWFKIDLSQHEIMVDKEFYVSVQWLTAYVPHIGMDSSDPNLRSYDGEPGNWRLTLGNNFDYMIKAEVETPPQPSKEVEIVSKVEPSMNRVQMQIMINGDCKDLNNSGKQLMENLNFQFQTQEMSREINQQARLTFTNRLQQSLGDNVSCENFNMTYRYYLENQTFKAAMNLDINGSVSFNGSNYIVRTHWRWINASGDFEFDHLQRRYRFNFAKMLGFDLSNFNVPLEQWTREYDQNLNMTRYSLTIPPYNISTPYGEILIDPTQVIETPGETFVLGDLIQEGSVPIPEFDSPQMLGAIIISLLATTMIIKRKQLSFNKLEKF